MPFVKARLEAVDERRLCCPDAGARLVEREPLDAVDLRERSGPAGAGRPLQLEGVADGDVRVEVALGRPRLHDLAALLDDRAEVDELSLRHGVPGLLLELTPGHVEERLAGSRLALRDRPVAGVLAGEE